MASGSEFPSGTLGPAEWMNFIMGEEPPLGLSGTQDATNDKIYKLATRLFPSVDSLQGSYNLLQNLKEAISNPNKIQDLPRDSAASVTILLAEANKRYLGNDKLKSIFVKNINHTILTLADELSAKMGYGNMQLKDAGKLSDELINKLPIDFQAEGFHTMLHMLLWPPPNEEKALRVLAREGAKELILRENIESATPIDYAIHSSAAAVFGKMLSMITKEEFEELSKKRNLFSAALDIHRDYTSAKSSGNDLVKEKIQKSGQIVELLIAKAGKEAIIHAPKDEMTWLELAVQNRNISAVEKMLNMISFEEFKQLAQNTNLFQIALLNLSDEASSSLESTETPSAKICSLLEVKAGDDPDLKRIIEEIIQVLEEGLGT